MLRLLEIVENIGNTFSNEAISNYVLMYLEEGRIISEKTGFDYHCLSIGTGTSYRTRTTLLSLRVPSITCI